MRLQLGMIVQRDGILYKVVGTSDGPVAYLRPAGTEPRDPCRHCEISVVDSSPLAHEFKPVPTPTDDPWSGS